MDDNIASTKENIAVYESLRNEIISTQNTRTNLIVYMYTVYVVLLGFGIQASRVFYVISFIILISFHSKINRSKYTIARLSTYIRVFFEAEDENQGIHWETANVEQDLAVFKDKMGENKFVSFVSGTSSVQLGVISITCYIVTAINDQFFGETGSTIPLVVDCILILISIVCLYVLSCLYGDYKVKTTDLEKMEKAYTAFKNKVYPKICTNEIKEELKEQKSP